MDTEEAGRPAAGGGASLAARGSGGGGGGAQLASWQRLKEWLQRCVLPVCRRLCAQLMFCVVSTFGMRCCH